MSNFFSVTQVTVRKMKFSIKDFFSKCDEIRSFLRIGSRLLRKSLRENVIFCAVSDKSYAFILCLETLHYPISEAAICRCSSK